MQMLNLMNSRHSRRPVRVIEAASVVASLLTLLSACGGSDQPTYREHHGCRLWAYALCADARAPMLFRDGDPLLDVCAALADGYDNRLWRTPILMWGFDGITRVTAGYDAEGRVTSFESDCGLDEPFTGSIEWGSDGRLARYRGRTNLDIEVETTPIYVDGLLTSYESALHYDEGGIDELARPEYGHDSQGRIVTVDTMGSWGPFHQQVEYDGELLAVETTDGFVFTDVPYRQTTAYTYDAEGRLTGTTTTSDSDTDPGPWVAEIEWTSDTDAHVEMWTGSIDVAVDSSGRLIRKDTHSAANGNDTMTWEWDDDGRLVEFWMYGE